MTLILTDTHATVDAELGQAVDVHDAVALRSGFVVLYDGTNTFVGFCVGTIGRAITYTKRGTIRLLNIQGSSGSPVGTLVYGIDHVTFTVVDNLRPPIGSIKANTRDPGAFVDHNIVFDADR